MLVHLAVLKAFFTSNVARRTIFLKYWFPLCAALIVCNVSLTAWTVECPLLNPYCLAARSPPSWIAASKRGFNSFSRSFPAVFGIHRGRCAPGDVELLFPLLMRISLCVFHCCGQIPSIRQALKVFTSTCGHWRRCHVLTWHVIFSVSAGMTSSLVAFLFCRPFTDCCERVSLWPCEEFLHQGSLFTVHVDGKV